ncbi:MAG: YncE family protein, partial [Methylophilaceae bacterium]
MINISLKIFLILSFILNLSGCQNSTVALITNQGDDTVSIVNLDDLEVIKTLQTDKGPLGVEFIDTNHAVISNTKNQTLQVINLNNFEITNRIKLGFTPLGMVSIKKEKRLYVSSWYENKIYLFDTQSWKQLLQIEVAKTPSGLAYNT